MKRIFILVVIVTAVITTSDAQHPNNSIRKIVRDYIIANIDSSDYPRKDNNVVSTFSIYDVKKDVNVDNYAIQLPITDTLLYYTIKQCSTHAPIHFMFVKNGKYVIVNMDKSLCDIEHQFLKMCRILCLGKHDVLYVLDKILSRYNANYKETLNSSCYLGNYPTTLD